MINTSALNKINKSISIFDIMTLTSLFGVYNEIDWKKIHLESNNLGSKQELMLKCHSENQQSKINLALLFKKQSSTNMYLDLDNEFVMLIPSKCINKLKFLFGNKVFLTPANVNFKISLLKMTLLKQINENEFSDRFSHLVKYQK
jgi:hypothetical protein